MKRYDYVILWKLADGSYEFYRLPFSSLKKAKEKIKELKVEVVNTKKKWFSKIRSNAGIRDYHIVKTEKNKNFLGGNYKWVIKELKKETEYSFERVSEWLEQEHKIFILIRPITTSEVDFTILYEIVFYMLDDVNYDGFKYKTLWDEEKEEWPVYKNKKDAQKRAIEEALKIIEKRNKNEQ